MSRAATGSRRQRLDQLVVERGLATSRARAQALILGAKVRTGLGDAARLDRKAGDLVDPDLPIELVAADPYVSRGGHKLAAALDAFGLDPSGRICLDVGASTGGFTDVLLQRGAARVYALDVGRGQLHERLRRDPRVVSLERTNARDIVSTTLPESVSLAVVDVAFISLALVLGPVTTAFANPDPNGLAHPDGRAGDIVALVKPQFEAGRAQVDRGVVRDPAVHRATVRAVIELARTIGLRPLGVVASPITGPEGNREFLVHLGVGPGPRKPAAALDQEVAEAVADA